LARREKTEDAPARVVALATGPLVGGGLLYAGFEPGGYGELAGVAEQGGDRVVVEDSTLTANMAFDGSTATRWASAEGC